MRTTTEKIIHVRHWNERLMSITVTRQRSFRFYAGQFVMLGLVIHQVPVYRAYSIVSSPYDEHLEFLSVKVPNGQFTGALSQIINGNSILVSEKPVGNLLLSQLSLLNSRRLLLFSTGTGIAPFLSLIKDLDVYDRFSEVCLFHSVKTVSDLVYRTEIKDLIKSDIPQGRLQYYSIVTQEKVPAIFHDRITIGLLESSLFRFYNLSGLNSHSDRVMICGNNEFNTDMKNLLEPNGFVMSKSMGSIGMMLQELAFVEK